MNLFLFLSTKIVCFLLDFLFLELFFTDELRSLFLRFLFEIGNSGSVQISDPGPESRRGSNPPERLHHTHCRIAHGEMKHGQS
jgi:hypothetical protein